MTEPRVTTSDIIQIIKEFLNEMPYWKNHREPPTVSQDFAKSMYDELLAKNWDLSPQYLEVTVHLMATLIEVKYFYPLLSIIC